MPYLLAIVCALQVWSLVILYFNRKDTRKVMSALDDLKAADAAETQEISTVGQALKDAIARIGQITIPSTVSDADAAAITADIQAHTADLQTIADALANVAPPAGS